jgi:hypothetical protein
MKKARQKSEGGLTGIEPQRGTKTAKSRQGFLTTKYTNHTKSLPHSSRQNGMTAGKGTNAAKSRLLNP